MMLNAFEVLGVSRNCELNDLRVAYRNKARLFHPDMGLIDTPEAFQELSRAYEILKNPQTRARLGDQAIFADRRVLISKELAVETRQLMKNLQVVRTRIRGRRES